MTAPSPNLVEAMRHAIETKGPLYDANERSKRAAQIAQDALDAQAARFADIMIVVKDALLMARELDGNQDRRHRAIDSALAVLDEEP